MSATTRRQKAEAARVSASTPPRPRERHRFWLVQRLRTPSAALGRTGFDSLFACDYMGSAEFEWGAIPDSLKRVRAAKRIVIRDERITWGGLTRDVWFVGPEQGLDAKVGDWRLWAAAGARESKENPYFAEAYGGHLEDWHRGPIAWWSLRDDIAWTLDGGTAEKLLAGFRGVTR